MGEGDFLFLTPFSLFWDFLLQFYTEKHTHLLGLEEQRMEGDGQEGRGRGLIGVEGRE